MLLWNPETSDKKEEQEEREYFNTIDAAELFFYDFNAKNRDYRTYENGDWVLIEDKIVRTVPESEYQNLSGDVSIIIGNNRYDHILFVWVESIGDEDLCYHFPIGAKNADDLNVLKTGDTLLLEIEIYDYEDADGIHEEIRGNVKGHPELVYDPVNTKTF